MKKKQCTVVERRIETRSIVSLVLAYIPMNYIWLNTNTQILCKLHCIIDIPVIIILGSEGADYCENWHAPHKLAVL